MRLLALGLVFCRPRKNRARQPFSAGGSLCPRENLGTLLVVRTRRENAIGIWWLRPGLLLNVLQCMGQSHDTMIQLQMSAGLRETAVRPGPATCDCQLVRTSDLNVSHLSYLIEKTSKSLVFYEFLPLCPGVLLVGLNCILLGDSVLTQKNSCFFLQAPV